APAHRRARAGAVASPGRGREQRLGAGPDQEPAHRACRFGHPNPVRGVSAQAAVREQRRYAMTTHAIDSTHTLGDYLYDAVFVAGIGGGLIALFFLAFDAIAFGQPFLTPTIMGKVLFE